MKFETISKIIKLGRLKFLIGGFLLFSFGALLAVLSGAEFILNRFLLGYAILFMAHLSVSYSNDYFDVGVDRYSKPTAISGGSGVLLENPELRTFSKRFAIVLMSLSMILALIFTILFSYPASFPILVLFGNLLGWYYTAPPLKLGYHKLSEIVIVLTVGFMVPGIGYFVLKKEFDILFLIFVLPLMFYGLSFIISVEIPDMEGDSLGNKNTLVVRKGRKFGFTLIAFSLSLGTLYFLILGTMNLVPTIINFLLIALFSLPPLCLGILGLLRRPTDRNSATKLVSRIVSSFYLFILMVDCYFAILLN